VCAYEPTLNLIISNLIANALKFTTHGQKPEIHIWSDQTSERVRLFIQDKGIGIPKEAISKIFGVFQRLHPIDQYPGTGIGLAIVQKGVERMGGKVGVESELSKGSTFWIEMPPGKSTQS
jgi:signal transduction histidine kinase